MGNCATQTRNKLSSQGDFSDLHSIQTRSETVDNENHPYFPKMMISIDHTKLSKTAHRINLGNLDKAIKYQQILKDAITEENPKEDFTTATPTKNTNTQRFKNESQESYLKSRSMSMKVTSSPDFVTSCDRITDRSKSIVKSPSQYVSFNPSTMQHSSTTPRETQEFNSQMHNPLSSDNRMRGAEADVLTSTTQRNNNETSPFFKNQPKFSKINAEEFQSQPRIHGESSFMNDSPENVRRVPPLNFQNVQQRFENTTTANTNNNNNTSQNNRGGRFSISAGKSQYQTINDRPSLEDAMNQPRNSTQTISSERQETSSSLRKIVFKSRPSVRSDAGNESQHLNHNSIGQNNSQQYTFADGVGQSGGGPRGSQNYQQDTHHNGIVSNDPETAVFNQISMNSVKENQVNDKKNRDTVNQMSPQMQKEQYQHLESQEQLNQQQYQQEQSMNQQQTQYQQQQQQQQSSQQQPQQFHSKQRTTTIPPRAPSHAVSYSGATTAATNSNNNTARSVTPERRHHSLPSQQPAFGTGVNNNGTHNSRKQNSADTTMLQAYSQTSISEIQPLKSSQALFNSSIPEQQQIVASGQSIQYNNPFSLQNTENRSSSVPPKVSPLVSKVDAILNSPNTKTQFHSTTKENVYQKYIQQQTYQYGRESPSPGRNNNINGLASSTTNPLGPSSIMNLASSSTTTYTQSSQGSETNKVYYDSQVRDIIASSKALLKKFPKSGEQSEQDKASLKESQQSNMNNIISFKDYQKEKQRENNNSTGTRSLSADSVGARKGNNFISYDGAKSPNSKGSKLGSSNENKTYYLNDVKLNRSPQFEGAAASFSKTIDANTRAIKSFMVDGNPFSYESSNSNLTDRVDNILRKANGMQTYSSRDTSTNGVVLRFDTDAGSEVSGKNTANVLTNSISNLNVNNSVNLKSTQQQIQQLQQNQSQLLEQFSAKLKERSTSDKENGQNKINEEVKVGSAVFNPPYMQQQPTDQNKDSQSIANGSATFIPQETTINQNMNNSLFLRKDQPYNEAEQSFAMANKNGQSMSISGTKQKYMNEISLDVSQNAINNSSIHHVQDFHKVNNNNNNNGSIIQQGNNNLNQTAPISLNNISIHPVSNNPFASTNSINRSKDNNTSQPHQHNLKQIHSPLTSMNNSMSYSKSNALFDTDGFAQFQKEKLEASPLATPKLPIHEIRSEGTSFTKFEPENPIPEASYEGSTRKVSVDATSRRQSKYSATGNSEINNERSRRQSNYDVVITPGSPYRKHPNTARTAYDYDNSNDEFSKPSSPVLSRHTARSILARGGEGSPQRRGSSASLQSAKYNQQKSKNPKIEELRGKYDICSVKSNSSNGGGGGGVNRYDTIKREQDYNDPRNKNSNVIINLNGKDQNEETASQGNMSIKSRSSSIAVSNTYYEDGNRASSQGGRRKSKRDHNEGIRRSKFEEEVANTSIGRSFNHSQHYDKNPSQNSSPKAIIKHSSNYNPISAQNSPSKTVRFELEGNSMPQVSPSQKSDYSNKRIGMQSPAGSQRRTSDRVIQQPQASNSPYRHQSKSPSSIMKRQQDKDDLFQSEQYDSQKMTTIQKVFLKKIDSIHQDLLERINKIADAKDTTSNNLVHESINQRSILSQHNTTNTTNQQHQQGGVQGTSYTNNSHQTNNIAGGGATSQNNRTYKSQAPYGSTLEQSPNKVSIPSLNLSDLQKHKFFDEKEWSQNLSPQNHHQNSHEVNNSTHNSKDTNNKDFDQQQTTKNISQQNPSPGRFTQKIRELAEELSPIPINHDSASPNKSVSQFAHSISDFKTNKSQQKYSNNHASTYSNDHQHAQNHQSRYNRSVGFEEFNNHDSNSTNHKQRSNHNTPDKYTIQSTTSYPNKQTSQTSSQQNNPKHVTVSISSLNTNEDLSSLSKGPLMKTMPVRGHNENEQFKDAYQYLESYTNRASGDDDDQSPTHKKHKMNEANRISTAQQIYSSYEKKNPNSYRSIHNRSSYNNEEEQYNQRTHKSLSPFRKDHASTTSTQDRRTNAYSNQSHGDNGMNYPNKYTTSSNEDEMRGRDYVDSRRSEQFSSRENYIHKNFSMALHSTDRDHQSNRSGTNSNRTKFNKDDSKSRVASNNPHSSSRYSNRYSHQDHNHGSSSPYSSHSQEKLPQPPINKPKILQKSQQRYQPFNTSNSSSHNLITLNLDQHPNTLANNKTQSSKFYQPGSYTSREQTSSPMTTISLKQLQDEANDMAGVHGFNTDRMRSNHHELQQNSGRKATKTTPPLHGNSAKEGSNQIYRGGNGYGAVQSERNFTLGVGENSMHPTYASEQDGIRQPTYNSRVNGSGGSLPAFGKRGSAHKLSDSKRRSPLTSVNYSDNITQSTPTRKNDVGETSPIPEQQSSHKSTNYSSYGQKLNSREPPASARLIEQDSSPLTNSNRKISSQANGGAYGSHTKKKISPFALRQDSENINTQDSQTNGDRIATGESEKKELYERLRSSPFIKQHELETPEDLSPRLEDSDPDIAEDEKEKKLRVEITKLKDKLDEFQRMSRDESHDSSYLNQSLGKKKGRRGVSGGAALNGNASRFSISSTSTTLGLKGLNDRPSFNTTDYMSKMLRGLEEMKKDRVRTPKKNKGKQNIFLDSVASKESGIAMMMSNSTNTAGGGGGSGLSQHNTNASHASMSGMNSNYPYRSNSSGRFSSKGGGQRTVGERMSQRGSGNKKGSAQNSARGVSDAFKQQRKNLELIDDNTISSGKGLKPSDIGSDLALNQLLKGSRRKDFSSGEQKRIISDKYR